MTIDERLERLLKACEAQRDSLKAEAAERRQQQQRKSQREREARQAVLAAIAAYIEALKGNGDEQTQQ